MNTCNSCLCKPVCVTCATLKSTLRGMKLKDIEVGDYMINGRLADLMDDIGKVLPKYCPYYKEAEAEADQE